MSASFDFESLASAPITLKTSLPGPIASERIAAGLGHQSPSLIHCYPLWVKRAAGCMVEDADGNVLLDCQAGVATTSTGHCHPAVAAAIAQQAQTLIHICGTDFHYPGYAELCNRLSRLAPGGTDDWQVFLTNSGTEGVEAAIKLARYHTKRQNIIAFRGAFHGRSLGSVTLTASKPKYKKGFGPLLPGVHHVDYAHCSECPIGRTFPSCGVACVTEGIERNLFHHTLPPEEVAAIVLEPVQGEGGYVVPPREFLVKLREICDQHGILLVYDEVQSGMGRTGKMFAADHFGVVPDLMVLAKGIASGMPLGAMMARKKFMSWGAGSHGSTTGGNPVCIAAALATLDLLEGGLVENSATVGAHLKAKLQAGLNPEKGVLEIRGLGLMIGVEFATHALATKVAHVCYERGLLVLECGRKSIRVSPPLVITREQADIAADLFIRTCEDAAAGRI
jgi:4-aminobutyrate aminotransferase